MQSMVQAVLDLAAVLQFTSLAVPMLGAGHAEWPLLLSASSHIRKVLEAAQSKPGGTTLEVGVQLHGAAPPIFCGGL